MLRGRVDLAISSGYAALVADEAMRPTPAPPGEPPSMMERFGLTPEQVGACYAPLAPMMAALNLGAGIPPYARIPSAQQFADGDGWDFTRGAWGWRAANIGSASVTEQGWAMIPALDSSISSPPLQIDVARYKAIHVRMAADTASRDAQIFFLDASGQADEERSLRWQLDSGPEMRTYRLNLGDTLGWGGQISGLRFDPVGAGDGGAVTVESIRLVP
jgi:hypothetical protein